MNTEELSNPNVTNKLIFQNKEDLKKSLKPKRAVEAKGYEQTRIPESERFKESLKQRRVVEPKGY